jgi:hypothetical protein
MYPYREPNARPAIDETTGLPLPPLPHRGALYAARSTFVSGAEPPGSQGGDSCHPPDVARDGRLSVRKPPLAASGKDDYGPRGR